MVNFDDSVPTGEAKKVQNRFHILSEGLGGNTALDKDLVRGLLDDIKNGSLPLHEIQTMYDILEEMIYLKDDVGLGAHENRVFKGSRDRFNTLRRDYPQGRPGLNEIFAEQISDMLVTRLVAIRTGLSTSEVRRAAEIMGQIAEAQNDLGISQSRNRDQGEDQGAYVLIDRVKEINETNGSRMLEFFQDKNVEESVRDAFVRESVTILMPISVLEPYEGATQDRPYTHFFKQVLEIRKDIMSGKVNEESIQRYGENLRQVAQRILEISEDDSERVLSQDIEVLSRNVELLVEVMGSISE